MQTVLLSDDVEAARCGDTQALARLLGARRRTVLRYAERHCVVHDVEDAVQETLLIASRHIRQLRAAVAFNGWLFRIVKRECDRMKRYWRSHVFDYAPERELEQPVVQPVDALRHDLQQAIAALPEHYRAVLLLRDVEDMRIDDIAATLALTREAAKARLHRARLLLREYLNP